MAPLVLLFRSHMSMYTNWATAFWENQSWLAIDSCSLHFKCIITLFKLSVKDCVCLTR
jgi:hypothetical protein